MSDASGEEYAGHYDITDMLASNGFQNATAWEQNFLEEMESVEEPSFEQENKLLEIQQKFSDEYEPMQHQLDKDD